MDRYSLVEYSAAPANVRAIYDDYLRSTASTAVPIWVKSLGADVHLLHAYWERAKGSLLQGSLPLVLKEMVIFVVSVENGSRYCSAAHAHAVLSLDPTLKFEDLSSLTTLGGEGQTRLPPAHRAALDFAIGVARDPNSVTDQAFARLQEADFSDAEIRELLSVIDLAMMFNSYTSAMRLPIDPEYRAVLPPLPA